MRRSVRTYGIAQPPVSHARACLVTSLIVPPSRCLAPWPQAVVQHIYKYCYSSVMIDDVTTRSLWRPLRLLMQRVDDEIARVYREMPEAEGVRPAWVFEILRLDAQGPMTIRELADSVGRTHSALSQKVAAMGKAGLVETRVGRDGRMRQVHLTERARALVGRMRSEWQATEEVLAEL